MYLLTENIFIKICALATCPEDKVWVTKKFRFFVNLNAILPLHEHAVCEKRHGAFKWL